MVVKLILERTSQFSSMLQVRVDGYLAQFNLNVFPTSQGDFQDLQGSWRRY